MISHAELRESEATLVQDDQDVSCHLSSLRLADDGVAGSPPQPHDIFLQWRREARAAGIIMPDSAIISTCTKTGQVSARTVCFRRMDLGRFVFLTDSRSKKCRELAENPIGAVGFLWAFNSGDKRRRTRQVRLEGVVEQLSPAAYEDLYWELIPNRRIRAYICEQGREADWEHLKSRHDQLLQDLEDGRDVLPMPDHFVAYELTPSTMEFYEEVDEEAANRVQFTREENDRWSLKHLNTQDILKVYN